MLSQSALLTVPAFLNACRVNPRLAGPDGMNPEANARALGMNDPILLAMNAGITAPNPHNTQAWRFRLTGPLSMLLYVDPERLLPVTDPTTRQIHIGQGTFLEVLKLHASRSGYSAKIDLFPEGTYSLRDTGTKPVARVSLVRDDSVRPHPLSAFIAERATNRDEYDGPLLSESELSQLLAAAAAEKSHIGFASLAQMKELLPILFSGMEIESRSRRLGEESRIWFRFNDSEIQTKRDGIALPDQGMSGFMRWMTESFFLGPDPESFFDKSSTDIFLSSYKRKIDSAKALVYWKTSTNTHTDWVECGRDYVRFQLALTQAGLKMHPLSQCLQEYEEMNELRPRVETILGQKGAQKIQMIARIGRSNYRYFTPRRRLKDMIVK